VGSTAAALIDMRTIPLAEAIRLCGGRCVRIVHSQDAIINVVKRTDDLVAGTGVGAFSPCFKPACRVPTL